MGNTRSVAAVKPIEKRLNTNTFLIERLVDGNCDYLQHVMPPYEPNIKVGVFGGTGNDKSNPLENQGIRIGDSDIHSLKSFTQANDSLTYEFDQNIKLTVFKRRDSIVYNLKTDTLDVTREVNPAVAKFYKPISMDSIEIDKLATIYKME